MAGFQTNGMDAVARGFYISLPYDAKVRVFDAAYGAGFPGHGDLWVVAFDLVLGPACFGVLLGVDACDAACEGLCGERNRCDGEDRSLQHDKSKQNGACQEYETCAGPDECGALSSLLWGGQAHKEVAL